MIVSLKTRLSGQNLIEFAILIPITLLIIVITFDFGRAVFYFSSLNTLIRESARYISVADYACNQSAFEMVVRDRVIGIDLNPNDPFTINQNTVVPNTMQIEVTRNNVITAPTCKATHPGQASVTVRAVFCFDPMTPLLASFLGGGICPSGTFPLDSSTTMYLEM